MTHRYASNIHVCTPPVHTYFAHTVQSWKPFTSRRRLADDMQAGQMPAQQANDPGYSGSVSNVLTTSKAAVVSSSSSSSAPVSGLITVPCTQPRSLCLSLSLSPYCVHILQWLFKPPLIPVLFPPCTHTYCSPHTYVSTLSPSTICLLLYLEYPDRRC